MEHINSSELFALIHDIILRKKLKSGSKDAVLKAVMDNVCCDDIWYRVEWLSKVCLKPDWSNPASIKLVTKSQLLKALASTGFGVIPEVLSGSSMSTPPGEDNPEDQPGSIMVGAEGESQAMVVEKEVGVEVRIEEGKADEETAMENKNGKVVMPVKDGDAGTAMENENGEGVMPVEDLRPVCPVPIYLCNPHTSPQSIPAGQGNPHIETDPI